MASSHVSSSAEPGGGEPRESVRSQVFGWLHFALRVFLALAILAGVSSVLLNIGGPGGGVIHKVPESIPTGEPYELTFMFTHDLGREREKYSDVECHYRVGKGKYAAASMAIVEKTSHRLVYEATLPPLQKGSSVEYYLTFLAQKSRNYDDFGPVPVR